MQAIQIELAVGSTQDVTRLGHHGDSELAVQLRVSKDLERDRGLFLTSYAAV